MGARSATWAAFAGTDDNAVVDGDFVVLESELQPVLRSLRKAGGNIVAIHHQMTGEEPRYLSRIRYCRRNACIARIISKRKAPLPFPAAGLMQPPKLSVLYGLTIRLRPAAMATLKP